MVMPRLCYTVYLFECWVISCFCCHLLTFQKILSETQSVSNGLDPDHDRHFVSPDLMTNHVPTSKERVIKMVKPLLC